VSEPRPAIEGGVPLRTAFLPLCRPSIGEEEKTAVMAALESGWLSSGPVVRAFEAELRAYLGATEVIPLSSCTAGLHATLVASGIGAGDEVITTPLTFVASANVIVHTGARPVFADIDPATFNLDPSEVRRRITPKTRAIIAVHHSGLPCDMESISAIAREHGLLVIEDAAHAIGTQIDGKQVGSAEDRVAVFSFYATKTMTTGEGGAVATGLSTLAAKIRLVSWHGIDNDAFNRYSAAGSWSYDVRFPGYKYNLTDPQAALGRVQLRRLEAMIERRERICQLYDEAFRSLPAIRQPPTRAGVRHSRHLYPIRIQPGALRIDRARFIEALRAEGVGASVHFIPVHLHSWYRDTLGFHRGDFPAAESVYDGLLSLPLYPDMDDRDAQDVIAAVRRIVTWFAR